MTQATFFADFASCSALVFELFRFEIVLGGFGIILTIVLLIVILPGRMILLPLFVNGSLVYGGIFESIRRRIGLISVTGGARLDWLRISI